METIMNVDPEVRRKSVYTHPKFTELSDIGITNKVMIEQAVLTYIKLIEVQFWFDVELLPLVEHQLVYIKGRKIETDEAFEYVLPLSTDSSHPVEGFEKYIDLACELGAKVESILIATYDETSSLLFYRISKGLTPPHKPANKDVMNKIPEWNEQQARWKY